MNKVEKLKQYIKELDGYKISETHFKIGSKVHSSVFYYAKRLFQNSYYTAHLAMLVAIQINKKLGDKNEPLTLVGYEFYSELLLSLVRKFLIDYGYKNVNHFVAIDLDENMKHIPDYAPLNKNAFIIVPIASTGSTALKIEEYVKSKIKSTDEVKFLENYNIIIATDSNSEFNDIKQTRQQQSFIRLNAVWHYPSDCILCFNNEDSKPLFETDKSSLTPALIFNLPSAKEIGILNIDDISNKNGKIDIAGVKFEDVIFDEALIYRKAKRNNEHFLFSTNTEILIEKNKERIKQWLRDLKKLLKIEATEKVVIISPCHYSNTGFINLVNDQLFNSSATVIHYQTDVDYLANFKLLNYGYLSRKDAKIYFVDDSLISGKTFFSIYDLFRYTLSYDIELKGAIFLSDKSSPDIHRRVSRAAKNICSFVSINLPVPPKVFDKKPLEHEIKRYENLSQAVLHDVLKKDYFLKKRDLAGDDSTSNNDNKGERHLRMFKATHKVYEFFEKSGTIDVEFESLLDVCGFKNNREGKMAVMKVLSQYPFLLYRPVREKAFEWHKKWFNSKLQDLKNELADYRGKTNFLTYESFQELKFLTRRSVFLGNYRVLSNDFLLIINQLFEIVNRPNTGDYTTYKHLTIANAEKGIQEKNLKDFHLFLLKQYIEIIDKNAWCAVRIIENLKEFDGRFGTFQGKQFIRMLRIEVATVINDFYAFLSKTVEWQDLFKKSGEDNFYDCSAILNDLDNSKIKLCLINCKSESLLKSNKFDICNKILGLKSDDDLNPQFLNYLAIKKFLDIEPNSDPPEIALAEKTDFIFQKLKGIFNVDANVGAFFIVTDGKDLPHLVYDKDSKDCRFLNELDGDKHKILTNFLKGENDGQNIDKKTIIEYVNKQENEWTDLYALRPNLLYEISINGPKWLLLIRISDPNLRINDSNYRTLGLMGFYSINDLQNDLLAKQLLMLLRKDIGLFIKKHHKNDEFSALRVMEMQNRYAYLAGHGRQMMQRLAREDNNTFRDVVGTMEKLQYLFATKLISHGGNSEDTKNQSDRDLLKNVFPCTEVNSDTITQIEKMGIEIYKSKIIENLVDISSINVIVDDEFTFHFNDKILEFICFELLINAKKNRFHFINGACTACQTDKNSLDIKFEVRQSKLIVELTSTGPSIPSGTKDKINSGFSIKQDYEISGLYLIHKLIKALNYQNNLKIDSAKQCSYCRNHKNKLKVELNPMNNGS